MAGSVVRVFGVVMAIMGLAGAGEERGELVADGRSAYVVVLRDGAGPCEETAAGELVEFLEGVTGCRLPVVGESGYDAGAGPCVSVGRTGQSEAILGASELAQLGPEDYVIAGEGGDLFLGGGSERGTLYAVYAFLESLGVRWLTKDCTVLPKVQRVGVPEGRVRGGPAFGYRDQVWNCNPDFKWQARQRLNGEFARIPEEWGGSVKVSERCHSFHNFVPIDKAAANPEWIALKADGTRDKPVPHCVQLCTTHPGVREWIVAGVKHRLGKDRSIRQIWVSQDDGPGGCFCERCVAERRAHGGDERYSANTLALVNHVARAIRDDFPGVQVKTLAYAYTLEPPEDMRGEDNVVVVLCGPHCVFHAMDGCEKNRAYVERLKGWTGVANVQTYFYGANNYAYFVPFPSWFAMCTDYVKAHAYGVKAVYRQGAGVGWGSEFAELRSYLTARMAWDPARDPVTEAREFVTGYYGPGGEAILDYLLWYRDRMAGNHGDEGLEGWRAYVDEEAIQQGESCFGRALDATEGFPEYHGRVRAAYLPTLYARVMRDLPPQPELRDGNYVLMPGALGERIRGAAALFVDIMKETGYTHWDENTIYEPETNPINALGKEHRYVMLTNGTDRAYVVPSLGGRLIRWDVGMLGRDVFQPPDVKTIGYPYSGGYEEYSVFRRSSEGIAVEFEVEALEENRRVVMKAQLRNGLEVTRTIELAEDAPRLRIESRYANPTDTVQKVKLRNHPLFAFDVFQDARLYYVAPTGAWQSESLFSESSRQDEKSLGAAEVGKPFWALGDRDRGFALVNRFSTEDLERLYAFWSDSFGCVTLELWQEPVELGRGDSQTLEHTYEFLDASFLEE